MNWKHIYRNAIEGASGALSMYGAAKGMYAMGSEIYAAGRGLYALRAMAPLIAAV